MDLMSLLPPEILSVVLTTAGPESYYNLCLVSTATRSLEVRLRRVIFCVDNIIGKFFKGSEESLIDEFKLGPLVIRKEIYNVDKYYTNSLSWEFKIQFPVGWIKFLCRSPMGGNTGKFQYYIDSFEYENGWKCHEFIANINKWINEIFEGKLNCLLLISYLYCGCIDCTLSRKPGETPIIPSVPVIYSINYQARDNTGDVFEVRYDGVIRYSGYENNHSIQTGFATRLLNEKWTDIINYDGVQLKYNGNYQWVMNQLYTDYMKLLRLDCFQG